MLSGEGSDRKVDSRAPGRRPSPLSTAWHALLAGAAIVLCAIALVFTARDAFADRTTKRDADKIVPMTIDVLRARGWSPPWKGKPARWWGQHAVANRKSVNKLRRAIRAQVHTGGPWGITRGLLCIHEHEGSWSDDGAPYYGGLQMDTQFQRSYGGVFLRELGTADNWPMYVQLAVALEAHLSGRGFGPWPTRKFCGL